ncbi:hypothetical protein AVEN_121443-1 [Araneus ventricosus]|uniref:Uncharacterized protein n=1 Tax=Araneus ventricosus TaxID=182803 RepID=A0A4Y2DMZ8_ARAVE|nr:hypothetical protein AVEN_121443-1 [Araneus ventricosus]
MWYLNALFNLLQHQNITVCKINNLKHEQNLEKHFESRCSGGKISASEPEGSCRNTIPPCLVHDARMCAWCAPNLTSGLFVDVSRKFGEGDACSGVVLVI